MDAGAVHRGAHEAIPMKVILQSESSECGLACLAMVASHFGSDLGIGDLRRQFIVSAKGVTLSGLIKYANGLDLLARPLKLELEALRDLELPAILHWNLDHFVVLERVTRNGLVILDPATGRRTVSVQEASNSFTGVVLAIERKLTFVSTQGKRRRTWAELGLDITGPIRRRIALSLFMAGMVELFVLAHPLYAQLVIDNALAAGDRSLLLTFLIGFSLLLAARVLVAFLRDWIALRLSLGLRYQWGSSVFSKLVNLPADYFQKRHTGDILSRFQSLDEIQSFISYGLIKAALDVILLVLALSVMFMYNGWLTAVVLSSAAVYCAFRWAVFYPLQRVNREQIVFSARENSYFLETLRAIIPIKLANKTADRAIQWQQYFSQVLRRNASTQMMMMAIDGADTLLRTLPTLALLYMGANMVQQNAMSVGMLVAFTIYADTLTGRLASLVATLTQFRLLGLHVERVADITEEKEEPAESAPNVGPPLQQGDLRMVDVSYRYGDNEPWILRKANLTIHPGEFVAIIGPSGAGKTTVAKILLGLVRPIEGALEYGGRSLDTVGLGAFRDEVACVLQDDHLLAGTIAENIAFFSERTDLDQVVSCAIASAIHEDIMAMPMGYRTLVGDMGAALSGGQRQRVLLARALYKAPKILVLDEATCHLDPVTEHSINQFLLQLGTTRIMIAHRAETQQLASRRLLLEDGTLRELEPLRGSSAEAACTFENEECKSSCTAMCKIA